MGVFLKRITKGAGDVAQLVACSSNIYPQSPGVESQHSVNQVWCKPVTQDVQEGISGTQHHLQLCLRPCFVLCFVLREANKKEGLMKRERDPMNVSEFHLIDWMGLRVQKGDLAWWLTAVTLSS